VKSKKKKFDKKNAQSFVLEPSSAPPEDVRAPELVEQPVGDAGGYDRREWELGEYGFANDGYDYTKHLRDIGAGLSVVLVQ
jgi:hypothetical protein